LNLVKDILANDSSLNTVQDVENKYKLSRLTSKDITAQVLKKGHHGVKNTTSGDFLLAVSPNKIVSTGSGKYSDSLIQTLEHGVDYRVRKYYENTASGAADTIKEVFQAVVTNSEGNGKYGLQEHLHNKSGIKYYRTNWFYSVFGPSGKQSNSKYQYSITISTNGKDGWKGYQDIANYMHDMYYYSTGNCDNEKDYDD
jgi:hypothetical protein